MKRNTLNLRSALFLFSCLLLFSCTDPEKLKLDRSISNGLILYQDNCIQCHGEDGNGLGTLYPPLAGSDYIENNQDSLACIIKWGRAGKMVVNGVEYNQPMPGVEKLLDDEVAHLINYIQNAWGNKNDFKSREEVASDLESCY